jgi:ferredoxin
MLTVFERLAETGSFPIALQADRCLRSRDRFSDCALCLDACPAKALHWDEALTFDSDACAACGLCLHLCPVGAFSGDAGVAALLKTVARLGAQGAIELVCAQHPGAETGPGVVDVALRINGCLAAVGPSIYASLFALGVSAVVVRLDACNACPIGQVLPHIRQNLEKARRVLWPLGLDQQIVATEDEPGLAGRPRPLHDAAALPISRRRLLRMLAPQQDSGAAQPLLPVDSPVAPAEKRVPPERLRLLAALERLPAADPQALCPAPLAGQRFARITANEACTACGVCAQACPVGALQLEFDDDPPRFRLRFAPAICTGCDACLHLCDADALDRGPVMSFAELLAAGWIEIASGAYRRCRKCGARFAGAAPADGLCPICAFRRTNPFGQRVPVRVVERD